MSFYTRRPNAYGQGGYGRRGGFPPTRHSAAPKSTDIDPTAPLGPVLKSISLQDIKGTLRTSELQAHNTKAIASFNLLSGPDVSIAIPGIPPKWTPLRDNRTLEEDSDTYYRDVNAAHNPQGPWHATVETLMKKPRNDPFQILACGSTLGNLIRFALGKPQDCRILVNYIGGVVHLTRRESSPKATIPNVYGYGHTFPEANTTWDKSVKSSTSHQRVVRFRFAGFDIAVRSEADGYLPDKVESLDYVSSLASPTDKTREITPSSIDDLGDAFANLGHQTPAGTGTGDMEVTDAGACVPQQAIFDLKTRSIKRMNEEAEIIAGEIPRLWVRRIPTLVLGYHRRGCFTRVVKKDLRQDVQRWEADNQDSLSRLGELLRIIIAAAKSEPSGKLELTLEAGSEALQLREQLHDAPPLFPKSTAARWEEWLTQYVDEQESQSEDDSEDDSENGSDTSDVQDGVKLEGNRSQFEGPSVCDEECGYCGKCK